MLLSFVWCYVSPVTVEKGGGREGGGRPHVHNVNISSLAQGFLVTLAFSRALLGPRTSICHHAWGWGCS